MSGLSLESPCIYCAGPLMLCGEDRCCEECDHPYQLDQMVRAIERGSSDPEAVDRDSYIAGFRDAKERFGDPEAVGLGVEPVGDEPDSIRVNGHMFVHVAACPCPRIQAEYARLTEAKPESPA